jgi:predicted metal-dependent peptidase|tara:strand:- start:3853 stop:5103 length:1251 start_codon:yes stop_codon:yes gene_type:complete
MAREFDIDYHAVQLMFAEPFWSAICRRISKVETRKLPTAGVTVEDGDLRMYYNPDWFKELEGKQVLGVFKHELMHLFYDHCTSRKRDPHHIWNIATDLAINSLIPREELPAQGVFPGEHPVDKEGNPQSGAMADLIASFEPGKSADWYFGELMKVAEEDDGCGGDGRGQPGDGEGQGQPGPTTMDDHDGWDKITDMDRDLTKGKVRQLVKDAVNQADSNNAWGSVPQELREELRKLISTQVNWRQLLRQFVGLSRRSDRTTSIKRRNRKYPLIHPGTKRKYHANIAVAVDMSGSVSDADLELLYGELDGLAKRTTFTFLPFDTEVDKENVFVWQKGKSVPAKRFRCGGTSFDAPVRYVNERKGEFDGLLILTDGYAPKPEPCKVRTGWIITPQGDGTSATGNSPVIPLQVKAESLG